jgi:hypothetical protein
MASGPQERNLWDDLDCGLNEGVQHPFMPKEMG